MRSALLSLLLALALVLSPGAGITLSMAGGDGCCGEGTACCCQPEPDQGSCCPSEAPTLLWTTACGCGSDHRVDLHWSLDPFVPSPRAPRLTFARPGASRIELSSEVLARRFPSPEAPPPRRDAS